MDTESLLKCLVITKTGMGGGTVWDVQSKPLTAANVAPRERSGLGSDSLNGRGAGQGGGVLARAAALTSRVRLKAPAPPPLCLPFLQTLLGCVSCRSMKKRGHLELNLCKPGWSGTQHLLLTHRSL